MSTAQTRTLRRALDAYGGNVQLLAQALGVPANDLYGWLSGARVPPTPVYMAALDVVARGRIQRTA